jgi:hypothetical protein
MDLFALSRLLWARYQTAAVLLVAVIVTGVIIAAGVAMVIPGMDTASVTLATLCVLMAPAAIASLVLFDFGQEKDLGATHSNCMEWLLRMPIASWKIAIVPIVFKTVWISCLWIILATTASRFTTGDETIPILGVCLAFSSSLVWVMAIAWRPFGHGWLRLFWLLVVLLSSYALISAVFVTSTADYQSWHGQAVALAGVLYAAGVLVTVRATQLARTHAVGLIGESSAAVAGAADEASRRPWSGPIRALVWHDLARTSGWLRYTTILGVIPTIVLLTLLTPLHIASLVFVLFLFGYFGMIAVNGVGESVHHESLPTLPPYLAASPIPTATIAWTRLITLLAIAATVFACVGFVFLGWSLWGANRATWSGWTLQRATALGRPDEAFWIGVRWSIVIPLSVAIVGAGRLASIQWITMAGRTWIAMAVMAITTIVLLIAGGLVLNWFLRQTDWESTSASLLGAWSYVPPVLIGLLGLKSATAVAATIALARSRLVTPGTISKAILIWAATTLFVAIGLWTLIPDARYTLSWSLTATALAIPLSRTLLLPIALNANRHR